MAYRSNRGRPRNLLHTGADRGGGRFNHDDHRALQANLRAQQRQADEAFDVKAGYARFTEGAPRVAYLFNMAQTTLVGDDKLERSALDMYFLQQDGSTFKASVAHEPYFFVALAPAEGGAASRPSSGGETAAQAGEREVRSSLEKEFEGMLSGVDGVELEDLQMPNHLSGTRKRFLKLRFRCTTELMSVRKRVQQRVERNTKRTAAGESLAADACAGGDPLCLLSDMREYDVPYITRASIDTSVRVGKWYTVTPLGSRADASNRGCVAVVAMDETFAGVPEPRILAWDIECTKAQLKFPDARVDHVYMISYMLDGKGFLLINREVVTEDVPDFEYTPQAAGGEKLPGVFVVTNCANEEAVLRCFIDHIKEVRPQIFVTYNGDYFDWPFVAQRCKPYGINLSEEVGVWPMCTNGRTPDDGVGAADVEWRGRTSVHIDCIYWVRRDSFLPQGSHGLKAVTREKLGYDPVEIDPEDMLSMALENPRHMASYSVSDAVATYYLYLKYVHAFVFSLSTIIPMPPDDVLRKGSGTLCESLLQVEAARGEIVAPNKQTESLDQRYKGHLLDSETYLGGHVECLETGIFRSDIPCSWKLVPEAFDGLIKKIDNALTFAIEVEYGMQRGDVSNYEEVRSTIVEKLEALRDHPTRMEDPVIYHLDVAAMYPNIILSNRLQPQAMVSEEVCGACDYSTDPSARCQRRMPWRWRGDFFPADDREVGMAKERLMGLGVEGRPYDELTPSEQAAAVKKELKAYSQTVYKRAKDTVEEDREAIVCQRENPFYVNTVRNFRDRRYDYKILTKKANKALAEATKCGNRLEVEVAKAKVSLYDSLQLAHKCILNSFYGYVMRKGARWHSMEMAGVVTFTGSNLIQQARQLVEQVGRPLELDTDGIWCVLPASFPQKFKFKTVSGGSLDIIYPCVMLNADVHDKYTNHQYQQLVPGTARTYTIRSECSIFFELDGPYAAMVLPASPEEGRLLKKRYAVFEDDGTLAELKGFELKRRGELQMIKVFQQEAFARFLEGDSLATCYDSVAEVANRWLDVLDTQGEDLTEEEIVELLSEKKSLTNKLEEYGEQKSMAISTAKRLAEFLGAEMVKDKGLACRLLVAKKPAGEAVTDRAIPAAIFQADEAKRRFFLRRWLKDSSMTDFDIRGILDWDYYRTRIAGAIQKIITIPAALQRVPNPVPRVAHPEWLAREVASDATSVKQTKLDGFFKKGGAPTAATAAVLRDAPPAPPPSHPPTDIEDGVGVGSLAPDAQPRAQARSGIMAKLGRVHLHQVAAAGVEDAAVVLAAPQGGGPGEPPAAPPLVVDEGPDAPPASVAPAPPLSPKMSSDELSEWLASRKKTWGDLRAKRKARLRAEAAANAPAATGKGKGGKHGSDKMALSTAGATVASRSGKQGAPLSNEPGVGHLQVVEIRPVSGKPGEYTVLAFTAPRRLQALRLVVDRTLYVNRVRSVESTSVVASLSTPAQDMRLPHDAHAHFMYQISLPERRFLRNIHAVRRCFDDPDTLAVYESRTPLLFRALARTGCIIQLLPARKAALLLSLQGGLLTTTAGLAVKNGELAFVGGAEGGAGKGGGSKAGKAKGGKTVSFAGTGGGGAKKQQAPLTFEGGKPQAGADVIQGAGLLLLGDDGEMQLVPDDAHSPHKLLRGGKHDATSSPAPGGAHERVSPPDGSPFPGASPHTVGSRAHSPLRATTSTRVGEVGEGAAATRRKGGGGSHDAPPPVDAATALEEARRARKESKTALATAFAGKRKQPSKLGALERMMQQQGVNALMGTGGRVGGQGLGGGGGPPLTGTAIPAALATTTFKLKDFEAPPCDILSYLNAVPSVASLTSPAVNNPVGAAVYRYGFLYHSAARSGGARSITALFIINETASQVADAVCRLLADRSRTERGLPSHIPLDHVTWASIRDTASKVRLVLEYPVTVQAHVFTADSRANVQKLGARKNQAAASGETLAKSVLERRFAEAVSAFSGRSETDFVAKVYAVGSPLDAWQRVDGLIEAASPQGGVRNPPLLLTASTPLSLHTLQLFLPSLSTVPVVRVPHPTADSDFRALQWTDTAAIRSITAFFQALHGWHWRLSVSRYASIPLANVSDVSALTSAVDGSDATDTEMLVEGTGRGNSKAADDVLEGIADLFFARTLEFNNHVLWSSTAAQPDLGGGEADAAVSTSASTSLQVRHSAGSSVGDKRHKAAIGVGSATTSRGLLESHNPVIDVPGCYRSVVLSLSVSGLAMNTILNSVHLRDVVGAGSEEDDAGGSEAGSSHLHRPSSRSSGASSGTSSCLHAFRALKRLVESWHKDRETMPVAGELLQRLYAWLASPASLLHDPALHRLVHALMHRCNELLLRAVRNMGFTIVHAQFDKIILATGKTSVEQAVNMALSAVTRLHSTPVFRDLDLGLAAAWHTLLWVDTANFVGIPVVMGGNGVTEAGIASDEQWAIRIIQATVREGGTELPEGEWKALRREYIRAAKGLSKPVGSWAITAGWTEDAAIPFKSLTREFVAKPTVERAARAFDRMASRFKESFEGAIVACVREGGGPAKPLLLQLSRYYEGDEAQEGAKQGGAEEWGQGSDGEGRAGKRPRSPDSEDASVVEAEEEDEEEEGGGGGAQGPAVVYVTQPSPGALPVLSQATPATADTKQLGLQHVLQCMIAGPSGRAEDAAEGEEEAAFVSSLVGGWVTHTAVQAVEILEEHWLSKGGSEGVRARPSGTLVRALCHVLALDGLAGDAVDSLRANLFKLASVKESDGAWEATSGAATFVLPDVVCRKCHAVRDLDLLRDTSRQAFQVEGGSRGEAHTVQWRWSCGSCQHAYDTDEIEQAMVGVAEHTSLTHATQDLVCKKCRRVRSSQTRRFCECSGAYEETARGGDLRASLLTFHTIAKAYGFTWLEETVTWLLGA